MDSQCKHTDKSPAPSSHCVQTLLSERWSGYFDRKGIERKGSLRLAEWAYKLGIKITMSWISSVSFCHYSSPRWPHCASMGCRTSSAQRNPVIRRPTNRLCTAGPIWRRAHEWKRAMERRLRTQTDESLKELTFPVTSATKKLRRFNPGSTVSARRTQSIVQALQSVIGAIKNEPITAALLFSRKIPCNWFSQHCYFCRQNDFVVFVGCELYFPPFQYFTAGL